MASPRSLPDGCGSPTSLLVQDAAAALTVVESFLAQVGTVDVEDLAELDPAEVLAGSLLRVTIQPRPNNDGETTPLDRPADSLLLRLWQRLSGRR